MPNPHLLAIDIGTQSARVVVMSEAGQVEFQDNQTLSIHRPASGYTEQDPLEILDATRQLLNKALHQAARLPWRFSVQPYWHGTVKLERP